MQIQFQRRAGWSKAVLRVTSDRAITDPFVDLVVEANWSTGRITRSYTMLFDPPALRRAPAAPTAQAQIPAPEQAHARHQRHAPGRGTPDSAAAAPTENVTVKAGDPRTHCQRPSPGRCVAGPMLVALLRANPDAFIQGNANRP